MAVSILGCLIAVAAAGGNARAADDLSLQQEPPLPVTGPNIVPGDGGGATCTDYGDHIDCWIDDGTFTVWTGTNSTRAAGAITQFLPNAENQYAITDPAATGGSINDPHYGGFGAFGWHHARRDGCCDTSASYMSNADIIPWWSIDARRKSSGTDPFGVSSVTHTTPSFNGTYYQFDVTVNYRDLWKDPAMTVAYHYEFYNGTVTAGGGVRVWIYVYEHCPSGGCGAASGSGRSNTFVKEPKVALSLSPNPDGSVRYPHLSAYDEFGNLLSQCNVATLPEATAGSCQIPTGALLNGVTRIRWDDANGGCGGHPYCVNAVFRAYPGGVAPHSSVSYLWANSSYGLYAWALASDSRSCFGLYGAELTNGTAPNCNPPAQAGTLADTYGGCVNVSDYQGVPKRWEVHKLNGWEQMLATGWEGGNGGQDCPLASKAFGPEGEIWGVYANFSYGPGWDLQK